MYLPLFRLTPFLCHTLSRTTLQRAFYKTTTNKHRGRAQYLSLKHFFHSSNITTLSTTFGLLARKIITSVHRTHSQSHGTHCRNKCCYTAYDVFSPAETIFGRHLLGVSVSLRSAASNMLEIITNCSLINTVCSSVRIKKMLFISLNMNQHTKIMIFLWRILTGMETL